jgi:hypothetical protein
MLKIYKDLFLNIFNMANIVNKVSAKYITKNTITPVMELFLRIINQKSPMIISNRNLRLKATSVCIVWDSGSRVCPLRKIKIVRADMDANRIDSMAISLRCRLTPKRDLITDPATVSRITINKRITIYLTILFTWRIT